MSGRGRAGLARLAVLGLAPLLVAASDPAGDVAGCRGGAAGGAPDLVRAEGAIVELGTSATWTLTFAEPLETPDAEGRPFRVDVAIRDPSVPGVTFAYYRNVNRLVRFDAARDPRTEIYLLAERGTNVFNAPVIEGASMTIQVPGRTLSDDEDLTGTSPGLEALRWTVIVRDEGACDFLGAGRPTHRLRSATQAPPVAPGPTAAPPSSGLPWFVAGAVLALAGLAAILARSRRPPTASRS
jgi:hypothetical protein